MIKVVILATEGCLFSTICGPMDMFLQAGVLWNGIMGKDPSPYFEVSIVTCNGKPVMAQNQVPIIPKCAISDIEHVDLIIIPSLGFRFNSQDDDADKQRQWLINCYNKGTDLASICTGAFILASTGLLDGKSATTHWGVTKQFNKQFPKINLKTELMVTDEGRLFCGGGLTADLNLALYLINKYCGREVALQSSRCTLVDLDRLSQLPFSVFSPDKSHNDSEILEIQNWIDDNYSSIITIDLLALKIGMSSRQFNRRFKIATGQTAVKYIQLIRVEVAKKILVRDKCSFDDIATKVGYENISFFRKIFRQSTGLSPTNYRKKFSHFNV